MKFSKFCGLIFEASGSFIVNPLYQLDSSLQQKNNKNKFFEIRKEILMIISNNRKFILQKNIEADVDRLRKLSKNIFEIIETNRGPRVIIHKNYDPRCMTLIGVIGPGKGLQGTPAAGYEFNKVVLLEISVKRSISRRLFSWLNRRREWFRLSDDQRVLVMPFVAKALSIAAVRGD